MKKGFTLIELLLVLAIASILIVASFASFRNAAKSSADAKRKSDLNSIQKTLELYYQDNQVYPPSVGDAVALEAGGELCHPGGCDVQIYAQKFPTDTGGTNYVYISPDQTSYQLYACIENANDNGPGVNQDGYGYDCGVNACAPCKYGVASSNSQP